MRYTQSQVRELLGLPLQTYRYWASSVPHLASRSGKAASFSTGDLLGLQLTKEVCVGLGISVGRIRTGLECMFSALDGSSWPTNDGCLLALSPERADFLGVDELAASGRLERATLIVPCVPVMDWLRARLLIGASFQADRQATLPLLVAVAPAGAAASNRPSSPRRRRA